MEMNNIGSDIEMTGAVESNVDARKRKHRVHGDSLQKSIRVKLAHDAKDDGVAVSQTEITAPNEASSLKALDANDTRGAQAFGLALGGGKVGNAAGKVADVVGPSKTESSTSVKVIGGGSGDEKGGCVASGGHPTPQDVVGASIFGASSGRYVNMCNIDDITAAIGFLMERLDIHVNSYELMLSFRVTDDPDIGDFGPLEEHWDVKQWKALRDEYNKNIDLLQDHRMFMQHLIRWTPKSDLPDLVRAGIPQCVKLTELQVEYEEWGFLTKDFEAAIGLKDNFHDKQYIKLTISGLAEQVAIMEHCPYFDQPDFKIRKSPYLIQTKALLSVLNDQYEYLTWEEIKRAEKAELEKQKKAEAAKSRAKETAALTSKLIEYEPVLGSKPIAAMKPTPSAMEPIEYEPVLGSKPITNTVAGQPETGEGDDAYDPAIDYPPPSPTNSADDAYDPAIHYPPASPTNVADDDYEPGRDYPEIDRMMAS